MFFVDFAPQLGDGFLHMSPQRMFATTPLIKLGDENFKNVSWRARGQCYDFSNIFAEKFGENFAVFVQNVANFANFGSQHRVFLENAIFSPKIGENRRKL
jgi:hypothetical protein